MTLLMQIGASAAFAENAYCRSILRNEPSGRQDRVFRTSHSERVSYRLTGPASAKRIFVFLNGIDKNMSQWDQVISEMKSQNSKDLYLQVDLLGQGRTSDVNPLYTDRIAYQEQVRILDELLSFVRKQNHEVVIVGHSYGGGIGARYVADHPGAVKTVIMISPFVDHLEVYQPGLGPFMWMAKSAAEMMGLKEFYETNVQLGSELGTAANWMTYSFFHQSEGHIADVINLTRGIRDLDMAGALRKAGTTEMNLVISQYDEVVPPAAHHHLWQNVPDQNRGDLVTLYSTHESVTLFPKKISDLVIELSSQ